MKHIVFSTTLLTIFGSAMADDDYVVSGLNTFDLDGNGQITKSEYDQAFERKMTAKVEWLDTNKDGVISPEEFRSQHEAEYAQRWARWDADGDGVASVSEIEARKHEVRDAMKTHRDQ